MSLYDAGLGVMCYNMVARFVQRVLVHDFVQHKTIYRERNFARFSNTPWTF